MEAKQVEKALVSVIKEIQTNSGLACPELNGATIPAQQVPKFDSKVWIAATTMVSGNLGVTIPDDANIFYDKKAKTALNVSQIVDLICDIAIDDGSSEDVA